MNDCIMDRVAILWDEAQEIAHKIDQERRAATKGLSYTDDLYLVNKICDEYNDKAREAVAPYNEKIADLLNTYKQTHERRAAVVNICNARPNWNGCAYCDKYKYSTVAHECWKQDDKCDCCGVSEERL